MCSYSVYQISESLSVKHFGKINKLYEVWDAILNEHTKMLNTEQTNNVI